MRLMKISARMMLIGLAMIAVAGCSKKTAEQTTTETAPPVATEFKVVEFQLGKSVDADKRVVMVANEFSPSDTIFVSVATEGATPTATLGAKWTFGPEGQLINEMTEAVTGAANTEFHISNPDGFPAGTYKVEITLDGATVGTKEFQVK